MKIMDLYAEWLGSASHEAAKARAKKRKKREKRKPKKLIHSVCQAGAPK